MTTLWICNLKRQLKYLTRFIFHLNFCKEYQQLEVGCLFNQNSDRNCSSNFIFNLLFQLEKTNFKVFPQNSDRTYSRITIRIPIGKAAFFAQLFLKPFIPKAIQNSVVQLCNIPHGFAFRKPQLGTSIKSAFLGFFSSFHRY